MKSTINLIPIFLLLLIGCTKETNQVKNNKNPKLVIGIVVDQMRYDYITRFWEDYGDGGIKRIVNKGFNCKNAHFNYNNTQTGPGHASVYTGTTPSHHGIIENSWYDPTLGKSVYCVSDSTVQGVGVDSESGMMSPKQLLTTTVTDQLKLHTQKEAKVYSISIKDRGAILPGGHTADAAYWLYGKDKGVWMTSTYYTDKLPEWVNEYNQQDPLAKYKKDWDLLNPAEDYQESGSDENIYEGPFKGQEKATFPHQLPKIWDQNNGYDIIKATPYGNSALTDFAIEMLENEQLGKDNVTDFLAIGYSSTDYVGHRFGVNSVEVQDTYLRLDLELEKLLTALDTQVGKGNYTLFLTADHAAVHVPQFLKDEKVHADYFSLSNLKEELNEYLFSIYKAPNCIKHIKNKSVFLDKVTLQKFKLSSTEIQEKIAEKLLENTMISHTFTAYQLKHYEYSKGMKAKHQKGFHPKRSGDVFFELAPNTIRYPKYGSTHGSAYNYDTHVPILFYGNGIKNGSTTKRVVITDIAPTISSLLGIAFPVSATGNPIDKVFID